MSPGETFRLTERVAPAIDQLGDFAASLTYERLPPLVRDRLPVMLTDLAGVTIAGVRTPEVEALVRAWRAPAGSTPPPGTSLRTTPETAAFIAAVAACALELDEGNKHAAGHPAAHVVFAAIAAAQLADRPVPGRSFLTAVAAGYEVAARFGRATRTGPDWHPHGHWGATGAACAAALILGGSRAQVAGAVDAAAGLLQVTPWQTVLGGEFTRNLWIAGANQAGLNAARLALSGLARNIGAAAHSLGDLMGSLDPESLTRDLGVEWLTTKGYLKRHAACSYTHPAVDLVEALRASRPWQPAEIARVDVRTHSLARPLLRRHPETRLAAMFSLPFVVSTAMVADGVTPQTMQPSTSGFRTAEEFSARVHVTVDEQLDAYLPRIRVTELAVTFADGEVVALCQPNPIGDADHFPLAAADVSEKLARLIGPIDAAQVETVFASLADSPDAAATLAQLP